MCQYTLITTILIITIVNFTIVIYKDGQFYDKDGNYYYKDGQFYDNKDGNFYFNNYKDGSILTMESLYAKAWLSTCKM